MLDEALRAASDRGLSVVEIVGEAGIGKTTLLEHSAPPRRGGRAGPERPLLGVRARRPVRAAARGARRPPRRARPAAGPDGVRAGRTGHDVPGAADGDAGGSRSSAISCTAPSAPCWSGWPRRAASSCCSTTCTGPIRPRSRWSPRSCAARPRRGCCWRSRTATARRVRRSTPSCAARPTPAAPAGWSRAADRGGGVAAARPRARRRRAAPAATPRAAATRFI